MSDPVPPAEPEQPAESRPAAFITAPPERLLFLCVHNAARSQMAEGLARALMPESVQIWSAGTEPSAVHPCAIEVLKEIGIDISGQRSKHLDEVPWREADTIVSLCAESDSLCPVIGGNVRRVRWPLPDPGAAPEAERLERFREVRDEIRWRVSSLWPRER